jgi:RNA 2',3'-cyclic 3'-phosphodiesterase
LFIALWPGPAVRAALAALRDAIGWPPGAAPVNDAQLHLTLHFLGAVSAALLPQLVPGLRVTVRPFALQIGAAVPWPRGLVVAPLAAVPAALLTLQTELAAALARLGLAAEDRPFHPHVTLARRACGAHLPPGSAPLRWRSGGYALVGSDRGAYRVLARYGERGISLPTALQTATARTPPAAAPTRR